MPAPNPNSRSRRRQSAIRVPAASRIATAILTARSAGSAHGMGSLKNTMIPSPRELVERSLELGDERPQHPMVFAEEIEDFLGLPRHPQNSAWLFGRPPCRSPIWQSATHSPPQRRKVGALFPLPPFRLSKSQTGPCEEIESVVEPEIFEARVIVDAIDHCNKPL